MQFPPKNDLLPNKFKFKWLRDALEAGGRLSAVFERAISNDLLFIYTSLLEYNSKTRK